MMYRRMGPKELEKEIEKLKKLKEDRERMYVEEVVKKFIPVDKNDKIVEHIVYTNPMPVDRP